MNTCRNYEGQCRGILAQCVLPAVTCLLHQGEEPITCLSCFFWQALFFFSLRLPLGEMIYDSFSARLKYSGQHWACTSSAQHPHSPEDSIVSGHWYGIFFYHYDGLCKPGCGRSHLRDGLWLGQVVQLIKRGQLPKFFNCLLSLPHPGLDSDLTQTSGQKNGRHFPVLLSLP